MSKQLASAVHLTDESGIVHSFLPGATPPKWARKLITNPKAWAGADEQDAAEQPTDAESAQSDSDENTDGDDQNADGDGADGAASDEQSADADAVAVPKKNASTDAWRKYADAKGFETDDDVSRADIIAALEAAKIPTE